MVARSPIAVAFGLALIGLLSPVHAGPPELEPPDRVDETTGFWLSVELIGPRGAQVDAAAALVDEAIEAAVPRGGRPPPGELVGRAANLEQALAWIDRHAFGEPALGFATPGSADRSTPIPGGRLFETHGVVMTGLVVTAADDSGGTREYPWPSQSMMPTPVDSDWRAAELIADRVPLFAAPAPIVPPASERYLELGSTSEVWLIGAIDRCDAAGWCMRWAQVIAHQGDHFHAGWLPNFYVVPSSSWQHGSSSPLVKARRFALVEAHREPGRVGFVLVEREAEGPTHMTGFVVEHLGRDWPSATLTLLSGTLTLTIAGTIVEQRELAAAPLAPLAPAGP